jgi:hypothetical protein
MPWSLRVRLTFYIPGQYLWFSVGTILGKIHAKLKASKAFTLLMFFFEYLSLLTNVGVQKKVGNQPYGVSIKPTLCASKTTPEGKRPKADSETLEMVQLCIDIQRWIPTGGKIMVIGSIAISQAGLGSHTWSGKTGFVAVARVSVTLWGVQRSQGGS